MEMNFCRRCGGALMNQRDHVFTCPNGHVLFANASPAVTMLLVDGQKRALLGRRSIQPHLGKLDLPGGFCDGSELIEDALARETQEELGLSPSDYGKPQFLLSTIDPYEYKGETLTVVTLVFWARIKPSAVPRPDDDITGLDWLSYSDIDFDEVCFESARASLRQLRKQGVI